MPRVAFLGPLGTFSHQAAFEYFGRTVEYVEHPTIRGVAEALGPEVDLAIIPRENSIFGAVTETFDLLRLPSFGTTVFIKGHVTLQIQHCILARRGTDLTNAQRVLSHEQALGQCAAFLAERLPRATLVKTTSTAAAAQAVAEGSDYDVAIASEVCSTVFPQLQVLERNVQQVDQNYTRFFILGQTLNDSLPGSVLDDSTGDNHVQHGCLRFMHSKDTEGVSLTNTLGSLGLLVAQIERRPAPGHKPFASVYFLEVLDQGRNDGKSVASRHRWLGQLDDAVRRMYEAGVDCAILGIW